MPDFYTCISIIFAALVSPLVLFLNGVIAVWQMFSRKKATVNPAKSIIVITGCDTGFGAMTSVKLSEMGYMVVAGCLTEDGANRLKGTVAETVLCDVTKQEDVNKLAAATEALANKSNGKVWAVVNNAGIGIGGVYDFVTMDIVRRVMEVNYFAVVMVTKAMLPLLKRNPGSRIVNLSSLAGFFSSPMLGPYSASKHAVEGMAKALRQELSPWGIHVCNVNPGFMRTPIMEGGKEKVAQYLGSDPAAAEVAAQYHLEEASEAMHRSMNAVAENPDVTRDTIIAAIEDAAPQFWQLPGMQSQFMRHLACAGSGLQDLMNLNGMTPAPRPTAEALKKFRG